MKKKGGKVSLIIDAGAGLMKGPGRLDEEIIFKKMKAIGLEGEVRKLSSSITSSKPGTKGNRKTEVVDKYLVETPVDYGDGSPWDVAFAARRAGVQSSFVEPDLWSEFWVEPDKKQNAKSVGASTGPNCSIKAKWDTDWKAPADFEYWHLDDDHSQLRSARTEAAMIANGPIRIAHFDTGYDHNHHGSEPLNMRFDLQRSFIEDENNKEAWDRNSAGMLRQPGHGTATMALLAGKKVQVPTKPTINEEIGGAPFAEIIPCRIAKSVILFKNSAFYEALMYITQLHKANTPVHVLSMSMGGLASKSWADAVNAAYEAGIFMVTAAGNNQGRKTPTHLVYPSRFNRVLAACGVTYEDKPYKTSKPEFEMQGNYGPSKLMDTAMAAYTPNTPWAEMGCGSGISFSGAGTSSATPQLAAAAACYWKKYKQELDVLDEGWKKVEAIRNALFSTAYKTGMKDERDFFGQGIVQAHAAMQVGVKKTGLKMQEADHVRFPIFNVIFKSQMKNLASPGEAPMIELEILQAVNNSLELQKILGNKEYNELSKAAQKKFMDNIIADKNTSMVLSKFLKEQRAKNKTT